MSLTRFLLFMLLVAGPAATQAVEFDEKLKAPRAVSSAGLKARFDAVSARVTGPGSVDALDAVRDRALAREIFDARWMLGALVDARVALPELEAAGFKANGDGSYTFKAGEHPAWRVLADDLLVLADPVVLAKLESMFLARGFRPEDYATLREYVTQHDLKRAVGEEQLALLISSGKMAKKLQKLKRLDDNFMSSYFYQKQWALSESERRWAVGLLDALEPRARRVLQSYFSEVATEGYIAPTSTVEAYQHEKALLLRPDLERVARNAFAEGQL